MNHWRGNRLGGWVERSTRGRGALRIKIGADTAEVRRRRWRCARGRPNGLGRERDGFRLPRRAGGARRYSRGREGREWFAGSFPGAGAADRRSNDQQPDCEPAHLGRSASQSLRHRTSSSPRACGLPHTPPVRSESSVIQRAGPFPTRVRLISRRSSSCNPDSGSLPGATRRSRRWHGPRHAR